MRIVSGKYRGLKLNEFEGSAIRPTADRVKESLFNIIYSRVAGSKVLDLFCGSGNLGIESLSRGAREVDFNDVSPSSVKLLKSNLSKLRGENAYTVTTGDFRSFLMRSAGGYDIIFIDPPYADESGICALELISERRLLAEGGIAVYERDRAFAGNIQGLKVYDERKYGKTYLTFFAREEDEQ